MRNPERLQYREYWSPSECAAVLGRSDSYWRDLFNRGIVAGYRESGRAVYHISAASARAHLQSLCAKQPQVTELEKARATTRASMRDFRAKLHHSEVASGTLTPYSSTPT